MTDENNDDGDKGTVGSGVPAPPSTELLYRSNPPPKKPVVDLDVIRAASNHPDNATGLQIVTEWVGASFDVRYAPDIEEAEIVVDSIQRRLQEVNGELKPVRKEKAATPKWTASARDNDLRGEEAPSEVPFSKWQRRHQFEAILSFIALGTVLLTSLFGAHGALVASGVPIFIADPTLPFLIAAIAPTASVAFKFIASAFRNEAARKKFRFGVHCASAASFATWLLLFAAKFDGFGGGLDLFDEPNGLIDRAFTALQIGAEVLIGASLFLNLDRLAARYAPDFEVPNFNHGVLVEREAELDAEKKRLEQELIPAKGRLEQLKADRKRHIAAAELAYLDRRSRFEPGT